MSIGLERGTVKLLEHDPAWKDEFEREAARLRELLPKDLGPFEHVGSTAIPGVPAKPIIDFIVGVAEARRGLELGALLNQAGYVHRPNGDTPDRILFVRGPESSRTHHFSFVTLGSSEWRNCVGFRDVLRSDFSLATRYSKLKHDLAERYPNDRALYTREKTPFFREVFEIITRKGNSYKANRSKERKSSVERNQ